MCNSATQIHFFLVSIFNAPLRFDLHLQCSETATLQFCDVDDHLSQTMQKIATRMGLHFITRRREVRVCGPFDLVQQFRMDLRAEIFITAQCSILTPVISGSSQSVQTPMATPRKAQQILIDAHQDMKSSSELLRADEIPLQQQNTGIGSAFISTV